ncbi:MAG: type II toxin-antitoxin system VapC family toxin [Planctomycetaceae bacterium]|nr:type II toxin-antitoxin system VapC family toxin [Planctomycetaceae bacterium]
MKLLLDTHAFLWMSLDDPKLSDTARNVIAELENELLLSPSTFWEIGIKISIRRYELQEPLDVFVDREVQRNGLVILPITSQHAGQVARLPFHHRDPFDRLLIAQSIVEQVPIISADKQLDAYGIERVW